MLGFDKKSLIEEIKRELLKELMFDKTFKKKLQTALDIKEDVIILNGSDIKLEVVKR